MNQEGLKGTFQRKAEGGGMLKPRQPSESYRNISSFAPGLVYGRMGQFMAEMRCQIFYNLAEHQTQSTKPQISHRLPSMLSLPRVRLLQSLWFLLLWAWRLGHYFGNLTVETVSLAVFKLLSVCKQS